MTKKLNNNDLIEFEKDIKQIYEKGLIKAQSIYLEITRNNL